ncbi:TDT family transporter [Actinoplanes sp. NPDC051851]|uniref:TDT family transporter n=1 Tax=Actinoplanes sp. NPDC051851 TaxID=3154753 RepID=UPI00341261DC
MTTPLQVRRPPQPSAAVAPPGPVPNWYAAVMGTGIVATAAASLPWRFPGLRDFAIAVWLLAVALLAVLLTGTLRNPRGWLAHRADPVVSHFYGTFPMALISVGAATLLIGRDVIGLPAALTVHAVLWTLGTISGLVTAIAVPFRQFTAPAQPAIPAIPAIPAMPAVPAAFGGWLVPVVPPMVSAATGALLVPYLPAGQLRLTLVVLCWAMFGLSLVAALVVITLIWQRLAAHRVGPAALVPTLWIVLGPLGQSVTAANLLGAAGADALPSPYGRAFVAFGVVFGLPVWGFALLWAALAGAVTVRTIRAGLPFSLGWWSFTFPVGTCVTATSALAAHTGSVLLAVLAVLFYLGLVAAWATVALRTVRALNRGMVPRPL